MNLMWRVTKYNPKFRDENGTYTNEEWSSFSDIGRSFQSKEFTIEEYKKCERLYVGAITTLMECNGITRLNVVDLEVYDEVESIDKKTTLSKEEIVTFVPEVLREHLWCKLEYKDSFYVHFGYDYNMYIGSKQECKNGIKKIKSSGLYTEEIESPYL